MFNCAFRFSLFISFTLSAVILCDSQTRFKQGAQKGSSLVQKGSGSQKLEQQNVREAFLNTSTKVATNVIK